MKWAAQRQADAWAKRHRGRNRSFLTIFLLILPSIIQGTPDDVRPAFEGYESNLNLFLRCGAIKEHPRKRPNFQQDAHPSACNNPKTRLPREGDGGNLRP